MIITCEKCSTQYEVPDESFEQKGRKVKCDNCGNVWFQESIKESIYDKISEALGFPEEPKEEAEFEEKIAEQEPVVEEKKPVFQEHLEKEMEHVFDDIASKVDELQKAEEFVAENIFIAPSEEKKEEVTPKKVEEQIVNDIKAEAQEKNIRESVAEYMSALDFSKIIKSFYNNLKINIVKLNALFFGLVLLTGLLLTTASFTFVGKNLIVSYYPPAALLYNKLGIKLRIPGAGIKIANLSANQEKDGSNYNIFIKGEIINTTSKTLFFPKLLVLLKDKENNILNKWTPTPDRKKIESGKTYPYELRFFDIPEDGILTEVTVKN